MAFAPLELIVFHDTTHGDLTGKVLGADPVFAGWYFVALDHPMEGVNHQSFRRVRLHEDFLSAA